MRASVVPMPPMCNFDACKFLRKQRERLAKLQYGEGARAQMTAPEWVEIGEACTGTDLRSMANQFNRSTRTLKRGIGSTAYVKMQTQQLSCDVSLAEAKEDPPKWAQSIPQWDETKQQQLFSIEDRQIRQTCEILVQRAIMAWGYADGVRPPRFFELVIPPMPTGSTYWSSVRKAEWFIIEFKWLRHTPPTPYINK